MSRNKININDVANLAGVSIATVSRYLNNERNRMSKVTAKKVGQAIEKLNYVPNAAARQLITSKSKTIAVIVVNISDTFSSTIFKGISSILEPAGYISVMLDTNSNQETEGELINAVGLNTYDGLILQPLSSDVAKIKSEVKRELPIVTLDRKLNFSPWPQVLIDNYNASKNAAKYFRKNDYKQVILLTSAIAIASTRQERVDGIKDIYPQAKIIEIDEENYNHTKIYQKITTLLGKAEEKTVVFSLKERWLTEFLPTLIEESYLIKNGNVLISGIADTEIVPSIWSEAMMVKQDPYTMGREAAKLLLNEINASGSNPEKITIPTEFDL